MLYISGYAIPSKKPLLVSLTAIHGIGRTSALNICEQAQLDPTQRTHTLTKKEVTAITKIIEASYTVGPDLKRQTRNNIQRLIDIQCYKGRRHQAGLPVRGQRTKTNAKTQRQLSRQHILQS